MSENVGCKRCRMENKMEARKISDLHDAIRSRRMEEIEVCAQHIKNMTRDVEIWKALEAAGKNPPFVGDVLHKLAEYGLNYSAVTPNAMAFVLRYDHGSDFAEEKLFKLKVPYLSDIPEDNPLHVAAMKGKDELVNLYLTEGKEHSLADEAKAMELLEIGHLWLRNSAEAVQHRELKYFRRALQIRSLRGLKRDAPLSQPKCFETAEDIDKLEEELREGYRVNLLLQSVALVEAYSLSSLVQNDSVDGWWLYCCSINRLQLSEIFNRRNTFKKVSDGESRKFNIADRQHGAFTWWEIYALCSVVRKADMRYPGIRFDCFSQRILPTSAEIPEIVMTPMLSSTVDLLLHHCNTPYYYQERLTLTGFILVLIKEKADLTFTMDRYPAVHQTIRREFNAEYLISERDFWYLPVEPYDEKWPSDFPQTILGRLSLALVNGKISSFLYRDSVIEVVLGTQWCCRLDRVGHEVEDYFAKKVPKLFCLAARVLPEKCVRKVSPRIRQGVKLHRIPTHTEDQLRAMMHRKSYDDKMKI